MSNSLLALSATLGLLFSVSGYAQNLTVSYSGPITLTDYSSGSPVVSTVNQQITNTYQADSNGNILPAYTITQVKGARTTVSTLSNPVPLTGPVAGYTFDMSNSVDGAPTVNVGQIEAHGVPGAFGSLTFLKSQVLGTGENLFLTGSVYVVTNADGSRTYYRNAQRIDANGNIVESETSALNSTSPSRPGLK